MRWNGVVFPATRAYLKAYADRNPAINSKNFESTETGDVTYDMWNQYKRSVKSQSKAIAEIDRIKALDVPWKRYIIYYISLLVTAVAVSIFVGITYRIPTGQIAGISSAFLVCLSIAFGLITFFGFMAEEEQDVEKLCDLYNRIKKERQ